MFLRSVRLRNFRNYAGEAVSLAPGLVAFTGDNGQGKTNLLEALCVLATTKSPLVERDRELIRWETRSAQIEAEVELSPPFPGRAGEVRQLAYEWRLENSSGRETVVRELRAGGVPQSQLAQWLGQLQIVAFFPHDLTLLSGEPEQRRRFLNLELGKTRPAHFADALRYRRALQQRNALLKYLSEHRAARASSGRNSGGPQAEGLGTLSEWNRQLVGYGARIMEQREQFLGELAPLLAQVHRELSGREEIFTVSYLPGFRSSPGEEMTASTFKARLTAALEMDHEVDLRRGSTQSGPHRDDLWFRLGEMDLRRYGSQGQQRLAVLSLKVALAQWVQQATGEAPVLLLDDALSELDATRREGLLYQAAQFPQSVLTATDSAFFQQVPAQIFSIQHGSIVSRQQDTTVGSRENREKQ